MLAVTFTNKAAREMHERVARADRPAGRGLVARHLPRAGGARMLRRHAELVGLKSNFTILDTDDQLRLLKQIMQAADIDDKTLAGARRCSASSSAGRTAASRPTR